jgi:hypothetical protein
MGKTQTAAAPETSWLAKLPQLRTSEDFERAIIGLDAERGAASRRIDALMSQQADALFTGTDVSALRGEINETQDQVSKIDAALAGARIRGEEAQRRETEARLADVTDDNARRADTLAKAWGRVATLVPALRQAFATIDIEERAIERNNGQIETLRQDLGISAADLPKAKTNTETIKREILGNPSGAPGADITPGLTRRAQDRDVFLRDLALFRRQAVAPTMFGTRGGS